MLDGKWRTSASQAQCAACGPKSLKIDTISPGIIPAGDRNINGLAFLVREKEQPSENVFDSNEDIYPAIIWQWCAILDDRRGGESACGIAHQRIKRRLIPETMVQLRTGASSVYANFRKRQQLCKPYCRGMTIFAEHASIKEGVLRLHL